MATNGSQVCRSKHEVIREIIGDLNKVPKPIVSEDMKEQLQIVLVQSLQIKRKYIFLTIVTEWCKTCT